MQTIHRQLIVTVLVIFIYFSQLPPICAQDYVRNFGTISKEDFDFLQYDADPEAEAVVLFDLGKSYFIQGNVSAFDVVFERHVRIKILNSAGIRWANDQIYYYRESLKTEEITDLEGFTYNFENGSLTKVPLTPQLVFNEQVNENWSLKKFAMPDVREGSIIEYRYKLISPYKFNLRDWKFQHKIPTLYSKYQVSITPFYEYVYILKGAGKFDEQKSYVEPGLTQNFQGTTYKELTHLFAMKNVPAFRDEEFITSEEDFMIQLDFQLSAVQQLNGVKTEIISTWPKLIAAFLKHEDFGKFINKASKASRELFIERDLAAKPERERAKAIVDYVKLNYSWNSYYGKYSSKSVRDLLFEKTGNVADLNLLMIGLLKAYGIDAEPVILSTRDHGKIPADYPFDHFFNYVIALIIIDEKPILADASEALVPFDNIPTRCLNDRGLIVKEGTESWVNLASSQTSSLSKSFRITLSDDPNFVHSRIKFSGQGYDGVNLRYRTQNKEEKVVEMMTDSKMEHVDSISTENFGEIERPYLISFSAKNKTERISEKLYVSPFLNEAISANPLKAKSRTYPIDMVYARRRIYTSEILIPPGYVLEYAPENVKISNVLFAIDYTVSPSEDGIIRIGGVFDLKSAVYRPEHYLLLKEAYNKVVDTFNQKLVFVPQNQLNVETGGE